jgi:acetyl esterase
MRSLEIIARGDIFIGGGAGRAGASTSVIPKKIMRLTIDPEVRAYLDWLASLAQPPLADQTPDAIRRQNKLNTAALAGELDDVAWIEDIEIPGPAGAMRARLYAGTEDRALPVLLYLHGGGWVIGDLDTHDPVCRALAARAGCAVVALDYRLAPENPFPAGLEDGWAALRWLHDQSQFDRERIAVGGDSSGGNLAAVLARWARDRDGPPIRAQLLIYPVTDSDLDTQSYREVGTGYGLTRDSMRWYWDQYVADPARRHSPDASPLRAQSLAGLPPALVLTCELDPLATEGIAYAEALRHAGVAVDHIHEPGMIHGYIRLSAAISRARKSWDDCARFLRRELA